MQELPGLDDAKRGLRGDTRAALALLEEANAIVPAHTFPPARAGLAAQLAEEHAAAGDADRCERALDAAASILAEANGDSSTTGFFSEQGNYAFWNETLLEGFRGICAVLLKAPKAVDVLTRALAQATTIERRVTVGTDLAAAHLHAGAPEVAAGELSEAYTLAITFGFPMGVQRILGVRAQLAPWSRLQEVRELDEQLRGLLAPGAPKGAARIRG